MLWFHAIGEWPPVSVICRWTGSSFAADDRVNAMIDRAWDEFLRQPDIHLFDGPMCRLEGFSARPDMLELLVSRTSYRIFLGTNMCHPELDALIGPEALANPLGLSCALVSRDGMLVMGRRNERVAYYPGRVHPFAGALEGGDPVDVFAEVRRELAEELSFGEADVTEMLCVALVEDRALRQPELVFLVGSTRTGAEIEQRMDPAEHVSCICIAAEEKTIEEALSAESLMTPVAIGSTLMWGRKMFGERWFERHRARFEIA